MKGDFTRMTFRQPRHYRGVRWQQGRVQNEADDNEQVDIVNHRIETETLDAVGASGVPAVGGGFEVGVSGSKLTLSRGRMYVGGLLCELDQDVTIDAQPDLPAGGDDSVKGKNYLVYVDAWVRHVTALEDPYLREKALGGPDTCTRMQTVCQAKLLLLEGPTANVDCESFGLEDLPGAQSTGRMRVSVSKTDDEGTPCLLPPKAGYRRLENQLYRVEIHNGGKAGEATFKWSRDNGTVAFAVRSRSGNTLELQDLGPDQEHSVDDRHLVELVDDASVLARQAGTLLGVGAPPQSSSITLEGTMPDDFAKGDQGLSRHPLVRRWDHQAPEDSPDGAIPIVVGPTIALEGGIEIEFAEGEYRTGDYWLIPARTVTADVEWPRDAKGEPSFEAPRSSPRAVAALAVVRRQDNTWKVNHDCRRRFVAQADHVEVDGIGGDGQLVLNEGDGGLVLPQPLRVRVRRGGRAWKGARVLFRVGLGKGTLAAAGGRVSGGDRSVTVRTDAHGLAEARWTLGSDESSQRVLVTLDEPNVQEGPSLAFGATYVEALVGRASMELSPGMDWYGVLDLLAKSPLAQDVAVTFGPGKYLLEGDKRIVFTNKRSVRIAGMGMGTVIASEGSPVVMELRGCQYVSVRDLFVDGVDGEVQAEAKEGIQGVLDVRGAFNVEVERVAARTATAAATRLACIAIDGTPTREGDTGVCEVRVRRCELTPGDEQVGLWIGACARVIVEDNVVGYAPHDDRTPVGLTLEEKLKDDEYARRVLGYALWGLSEVMPDELAAGWEVIELRGDAKKKVKVKPHLMLALKVRSWIEKLVTLEDREPGAFITKVEGKALEELRTGQLPGSWPVLLRSAILGIHRSPVAQAGIAVTGGELEEVFEVRKGSGGAAGGPAIERAAPSEGDDAAGAGGPVREARASLARVGDEAGIVRMGGDGPTGLPSGDLSSGDGGERPVVLGGGSAGGVVRFQKPAAVSYPRSKAEVRVMGCSISNVRQGVVVMPKGAGDEGEGKGEKLGTVEICGNVVGVDVSVDGIGLEHVGVSVASAESVVVARNRVDVVRRAQVETDAVGIEAEGIRVVGTLGWRVIVTENLLTTTQKGDGMGVQDVAVQVEAGEGSAEDGQRVAWKVVKGENAVFGNWS